MQPFVDCHLHTAQFSCDAVATLDELVQRAHRLGLSALCTTEHVDFDLQDECYGHYDYAQHVALRAQIRDGCPYARALDAGVPAVLIGAEVDYQVRFEPKVRAFLDGAEYDLVVGSVHYAGGRFALWDAYFDGPESERYLPQLEETLCAVRSGLFDVLGHLDIVKRYGVRHYGPFDYRRYAEPIEAILRACVETGTGLEINTSGLRGAPQETFPALPVLRRYRDLGGEILTLGSDAHRADDLARDIAHALGMAEAAGFRAITLFVDRQPVWLPLG